METMTYDQWIEHEKEYMEMRQKVWIEIMNNCAKEIDKEIVSMLKEKKDE